MNYMGEYEYSMLTYDFDNEYEIPTDIELGVIRSNGVVSCYAV